MSRGVSLVDFAMRDFGAARLEGHDQLAGNNVLTQDGRRPANELTPALARRCRGSSDIPLDSEVRSTVDTGAMADCCCPEPASAGPLAGCVECGTHGSRQASAIGHFH